MGPRRNARGAVVPPGVSPGDPLVPFPIAGNGDPGRAEPLSPSHGWDTGKEDSSVTAYAVTPPPEGGKALGKNGTLARQGHPALQEGRALQKTVVL